MKRVIRVCNGPLNMKLAGTAAVQFLRYMNVLLHFKATLYISDRSMILHVTVVLSSLVIKIHNCTVIMHLVLSIRLQVPRKMTGDYARSYLFRRYTILCVTGSI